MNIDEYGHVYLDEQECIKALYSKSLTDISKIFLPQDKADQFNHSLNINKDDFDKVNHTNNIKIDIKDFDKKNQLEWFMPDNYCPNLIELLYSQCSTEEQFNRVSEELELFIKHEMIELLHYLKYLVDTMRANNIVWGVGRGSSVASYVLFLIGIHKIDSIKYNLDIKEFLK